MRALVFEPGREPPVAFADVPEPVAAPDECVVDVAAISLNFVDLGLARGRRAQGDVLGLDAAGVVVTPAGDGSGPERGARVAGFGAGAWGEYAALKTRNVAVVPEALSTEIAAALPAAGVTAAQVVDALGDIRGRRVLVTGASGGVGRLTVQLLARADAVVHAAVGAPDRASGLRVAGAAAVHAGALPDESFDAVVDLVGGPLLAAAHALLRPGGRLLAVGRASGLPTTIDLEDARRFRPGSTIEAFGVAEPFGPALDRLLRLAADGGLDAAVALTLPWTAIDEAAAALSGRRVNGKLVLRVEDR